MADIFDEIGEDLRAERMQALLRRYGGLLLLLVVLVIAGVGGWQYWRGRQAEQADQVALAYVDASKLAGGTTLAGGSTPSRQQAEAEFQRLAETAPEGYRTLARLQEAALKADSGDLAAASTLWDAVSSDTQADPLLRGLADLTWVEHQVDKGDPAQVEGRLAGLIGPGNPWSALAREQRALLLIRTGQPDKAKDVLRALREDPAAPDGVRGRASGLLTQLGDAPKAEAAEGAGG